jgi:hypothetical protein
MLILIFKNFRLEVLIEASTQAEKGQVTDIKTFFFVTDSGAK